MVSELKKVNLQSDVFMVCLQHAFSTESFEIMGLLIGDNNNGETNISAAIILQRSDKKKDRVEISSEQLLKATEEAERLTKELKKEMRVVGWYHSHPHITVCPSQIDVGTQATYQMMDPSFVGLIFSVFSEDKNSKEQEVYLTCFQSKNNRSMEIPLQINYVQNISSTSFETMLKLQQILIHEEEEMAKNCENQPNILVKIQNNAVKLRSLSHITHILTRPLLNNIYERYEMCKTRKTFLTNQMKELQIEYNKLCDN